MSLAIRADECGLSQLPKTPANPLYVVACSGNSHEKWIVVLPLTSCKCDLAEVLLTYHVEMGWVTSTGSDIDLGLRLAAVETHRLVRRVELYIDALFVGQ